MSARDWIFLLLMIAAGSVVFLGAVQLFAYPHKRQESLGAILVGGGTALAMWPFFAYGSGDVPYQVGGLVLFGAGLVFLFRARQSAVRE